MNIELVNTLFNEGIIRELFKAGFVNPKVFSYHEIYLWVHAQIKTRSISKNQAVLEASVKFKRDERTVWRALNSFTSTDKEASVEQQN